MRHKSLIKQTNKLKTKSLIESSLHESITVQVIQNKTLLFALGSFVSLYHQKWWWLPLVSNDRSLSSWKVFMLSEYVQCADKCWHSLAYDPSFMTYLHILQTAFPVTHHCFCQAVHHHVSSFNIIQTLHQQTTLIAVWVKILKKATHSTQPRFCVMLQTTARHPQL